MPRRLPSGEDGYVAIAGSRYLVGPWGRRRLTVERSETEVTIRSSGYHSGGFHVVTYARSLATGVRHTLPLSHTVNRDGRQPRGGRAVTMARRGEVPEAAIVQRSNRASRVDTVTYGSVRFCWWFFLPSPRSGRVRRRH